VLGTSLTLNWTKGTDDVSAQSALQYLVYYSTNSSMDSVVNIKANGTQVGTYTADINTKPVTGLLDSTTYYFNVLIKDEAGNEAAYTKKTQVTADATAPTPGNSGIITTSSVVSDSVTLNWTAATDNVDAPSSLLYLAYYSTNPNLSSVAEIEANGTPVGSYE